MGREAAIKYIAEGYNVVGCARRPEVIREFTAAGGIAVKNSREVAEKSEIVIVYVLNDQQVIDVVTGPDGILDGCHKSTRVICMSTIDKDNLEWLAEKMCRKKGRFCGLPRNRRTGQDKGGNVDADRGRTQGSSGRMPACSRGTGKNHLHR